MVSFSLAILSNKLMKTSQTHEDLPQLYLASSSVYMCSYPETCAFVPTFMVVSFQGAFGMGTYDA
jgi:hypothetical protein